MKKNNFNAALNRAKQNGGHREKKLLYYFNGVLNSYKKETLL